MRTWLLSVLMVLAPASAHAQWREASTRHFVIYSQQSEAELRTTAEQLERLDGAMRIQLRRTDPDRSPATRLTIYVFRHREALQGFLGVSNGIAGIYQPRVSGSIALTHETAGWRRDRDSLDPRIVLFHEYAHHFLNSNFSFGAPLWFSEGYAEFWSTTTFERDGSVRYGVVGGHRSRELTYARPVPVRQLLTLRLPIRDPEVGIAAYGRGWVLSHYLSFEPSRAGQLNNYLRALADGRTAEQAAQSFGDLDQLNRDVERYMRGSSFAAATLTAAQVPSSPITIRLLRPGEQAIMAVRMRSKWGVNEEQAARLVTPAREVAQRFPDDSLVQVTLAEVEHDANNWRQSEAAADRAIAAAPNLVDAHLYKARAIWGRLAAAESATPEQWREVRREITAANRLDPDDPEPLVTFFDSFEAAGEHAPENAIDGLLLAQREASEDRELRIKAGRQLLIAGNAALARAVLAPVAADSHSGVLGGKVGEVLDTLATGDTVLALRQLDAALGARELRRRSR
jgi:hypothetical protein